MPPRQPDSITGIFEAEHWRPRDSADGNDFVIACLKDGTTIVGNAPQGDLIWQLPYQFYGQWENDPRHGKQFRFTTYRQQDPHSREGVVSYLRRHCNGIGGAIGGRLWDALGTDAVKVLRLDPARAVVAVNATPGRTHLTIDVARAASVALTAIQKFEDIKIELANLFSGRGFPGSLQDRVIKEWGGLAPARVKHDPFAMLSRGFPGCGFVRCDRLYSDLGLPPGRTRRQLMSIVHSIREARGGHTWFPAAMLKKQLEKNIGAGVKLDFPRAIKMGVRARWLAFRPDGFVAEYQAADNEWRLAQKIRELSIPHGVDWPSVADIEGIDSHQMRKLWDAFRGPVGILAGTPGTGKTWTLCRAIRTIADQHGLHNIAVAAPTGKAAVRITSTLASHGITLEATTIHRLLGITRNGHDGQGWGFEHDADNPLPYRFIIIDEVSMLETDLAASLFDAIAPGTHVLLVGDPYQLPPVGHGAPLRDLIAAGLPYGELTEIKRNDGAIVQACRLIKNGQQFAPPKAVNVAVGANWRHVEAHRGELQYQELDRLIRDVPPGIDPIWDLQIVCTVNEGNSEVSRKQLNEFLQAQLNPCGQRVGASRFRLGDKVICLTNTILPLADCDLLAHRKAQLAEARDRYAATSGFMDDDGEEEIGDFVANGEVGKVVAAGDNGKSMVVRFELPARSVKVALKGGRRKQRDDGDADGDQGDGNGESAGNGQAGEANNGNAGCDFDLAYAITCHKIQGSSARIVVALIDQSRGADWVACREFWYTLLSRAEQLVITIGQLAIMRRQCKRVSLRDRQTYLKEMITWKPDTPSNVATELETVNA